MLSRRGVTLLELVVSLGLVGIVGTSAYRVLASGQRTYLVQAQRLELQQTLRTAVTLLAAEVRELDAADGDLSGITPTSFTIRAPRQVGFACTSAVIGMPMAGVAAAILTIREDLFFGARDFNSATDSLLVFRDGDPRTAADDGWLRGRIAAAPMAGRCADGTPGRRLLAQLVLGNTTPDGIPAGTPIRGYELVTYSAYRAADGRWYLGIQDRLGGGPRQPIAGPLRGAAGLTAEYFDMHGAPTAVAAHVAELRIVVRAETAQPIRQGNGPAGYVTDSLATRVSLRNNRRQPADRPGP